MKIKIIKSRKKTWYENKVGSVYTSHEENAEHNGYICDELTQDSPDRLTKKYFVFKEDCEVLSL
jgi:hypothetical protein